MASVTFQVLEGIDKGRVFRELMTPVTIGREEGNILRLNDERVSRFHAKVQLDNGEVIITDLDSTNGTRVNGNVVQIRRLRIGDRINVGRSLLLFGSESEIRVRTETLLGTNVAAPGGQTKYTPGTIQGTFTNDDFDLEISPTDQVTNKEGTLFVNNRALPPLPQKMSPSQAARLSELLDFLHKQITNATENIQANDETNQVTLSYSDWQRVLGMQMLLARYVRAVSDPDALEG
jgi:pSer/pThr/pTyr-binding forkhead associated (FHA) protein